MTQRYNVVKTTIRRMYFSPNNVAQERMYEVKDDQGEHETRLYDDIDAAYDSAIRLNSRHNRQVKVQ